MREDWPSWADNVRQRDKTDGMGPLRRHPALVIGALVAVVVVIAAVLVVSPRGSSGDPAIAVVRTYLTSWSRADAAGMAAVTDHPPPDLSVRIATLATAAPGTHGTFTLRTIDGPQNARVARYHGHVDVAAFGPLDWDGALPLRRAQAAWRVRWQPDDLYPGLAEGQRLGIHRTWAPRAPILAADDTPLIADADAVTIGIEPDRVKDLAEVERVLQTVLGTDPAAVAKLVGAPGVKPTFFVPVRTVRAAAFTPLRPQLAPVPGVVFQRTTTRLGPKDGFAQPLVGTTGPVTAERLGQLGAPYRQGDTVGLSGLEAVYETVLAGTPAQDVVIEATDGTVVRSIVHRGGADPAPVQVTLDSAIQQAADAALDGLAQPAALVAIDSATGAIRAVANRPGDGFDRALDGRYPPGSTFKVVTAAALLAAGKSPDSVAPCPSQLTVGGLSFRNFEGEAPGAIPLHRAFAISCNTAFVGLASQLPPTAIGSAASSFGFGAPERLPIPTVGGAYPQPADAAEAAAAAIGQARVTASPLHMATVAATVASGQWRTPILVLQPAGQSAAQQPASPAPPPPLDPAVAGSLRALMKEVVSSGTGTAVTLAGVPVAGKTGTAEFGSGNPPQTHAWFVGYRGGLAFAVLVEGGGVGGRVAAPIAAKFLRPLSPS